MKRLLPVLTALLLASLFFTAVLAAEECAGGSCALTPETSAAVKKIPTGNVILGNEVVLRIRSASGGLSAEERALIVQKRLVEAISRPDMKADMVKVRQEKGQTSVWAGNVLIITVDPSSATDNKCTVAELAAIWAGNISRGIKEGQPYRSKNL